MNLASLSGCSEHIWFRTSRSLGSTMSSCVEHALSVGNLPAWYSSQPCSDAVAGDSASTLTSCLSMSKRQSKNMESPLRTCHFYRSKAVSLESTPTGVEESDHTKASVRYLVGKRWRTGHYEA